MPVPFCSAQFHVARWPKLLWHYRFPTESSQGAAWAVGEDGTPEAHSPHRVLGEGAGPAWWDLGGVGHLQSAGLDQFR